MMKLIRLLLILLISESSAAMDLDYGLYIQSYPQEQSAYSSLILENGKDLNLGKETSLSFDLYVREDNVLGCTFRIITDKAENIDLIFTYGEQNKRYPLLAVNDSIHQLPEEVVCNVWTPVKITLNVEKGHILLNYGTIELNIPHNFKGARSARVVFGKSTFEQFEFKEAASVNVRDIKVIREQKLFRYWELKKHANTLCYDSVERSPAIVINPHWLIDNHTNWEKLYTSNIPENTLFAFNAQEGDFYIVPDSKEIQIFNTNNKTLKLITTEGGSIAANAPNQLLYDKEQNQLVSYNLDEITHSTFSFNTKKWENVKPTQEHRFWNNTVCYSPEDTTLISFGGYGFYKYTNELIRLKPYENRLETRILSDIDPRYCPASVIVNDTLYIFGGRGCKAGRQELFPHFYYDLYAVDLRTYQVKKLWETEEIEEDFLPAENLLYNKELNSFYVFGVKQCQGASLYKINIHNKKLEEVSIPIEEKMEAQYIFANIYYSPSSNKLFALINKTMVDKSSTVTIYSINYPPLPMTSLHQIEYGQPKLLKSYSIRYIIWICVFIFSISFVLILIYRIKKRKKVVPATSTNTEIPVASAIPVPDERLHKESYYDFSKKCVQLLGGFCVKNKDGEDITAQFSPMLKHLLVLLILFTEKDGKGISGSKLIQYLWSDKSEESAKNNRNVYLSKLRVLLEKIGDIEIINKNNSWTIRFGEDVVCDYKEAMKYFNIIIDEQLQDQETLNRLLELLLKGILLPNVETDWVDNFKSNFSSQTIDMLTKLLNDPQLRLDNDFKLQIADTIFLHDYTNEDALYTKCSILYESGKRGLAKNVYDNFCKEYYTLLNTEYKYSLLDVIQDKD